MRCSVALINRNYGSYLGAAIDSALNQTVAPFEVVVVDDGSTDESRAVVESYGDRIVSVFTDHSGPVAATNTAVGHCSGDVICLLDSDDLMLPHRIETLLHRYAANPACEWIFHRVAHIDRRTRTPLATPLPYRFRSGFHDERRYVKWGWLPIGVPATSALSWRGPFLKRILPVPRQALYQDNYLKFASLGLAPGWITADILSLQGIHDANLYTTSPPFTQRVASLRNGVGMLPGLERLGLEMLGEHFAADAVIGRCTGVDLGEPYTKVLRSWIAALPPHRKLRFLLFCAAVGAERRPTYIHDQASTLTYLRR